LTDVTEPDPLAELQAAMTAHPVITRAEDLDPEQIPQIPYQKTDRVPEVFLPLEAYLTDALAEELGRPITPAMLRMMRGASYDGVGSRVALFEVLASEGGEVTHLVTASETPAGMSHARAATEGMSSPSMVALDVYDRLAGDFEAAAADAEFAAKKSTCPACPPGCNDCHKDRDCECYEHGVQYRDPDD